MMLDRQKKMLIAAIGLIIVAAGIWFLKAPATQPQPDESQKIGTVFFDQIRNGQPSEVWSSTTAEFKNAQGREAFLKFVKQHEFFSQPLEFDSMQTVNVQDKPRSEFVFRVPATKKTVRVVLGREAGAWKVDRLVAL